MRNIVARTVSGLVGILASVTALHAQAPAPAAAAPAAVFEVASVKPSNPDPSNPLSMIPMAAPQPGGRFMATNLPLRMLIGFAWELQDFQVSGGTAALMDAKYDITAKAAGGATLGQKQLVPMVRSLLIDRFKLKTRTEPREMAIYDLVIARSDGRLGPDLRPSKSDCANADELAAKQAEAISKGDLSAVMPKPGEFPKCTISPNLAGGPMNLAMHGDGQ